MLTVLVYLCFFLGVFQLAKLPFTIYSALKNPKKFGGAISGRGDNGTDGNNCDSGVSYNYSTNGNSSGISDINSHIDNVSVTDNRR